MQTLEENVLLAVLDDNEDKAKTLIAEMSQRERQEFHAAVEKLERLLTEGQ